MEEGIRNRKQWIENRREEVARIFAISVGGGAVRDSHLHVLVRLAPDGAGAWSDEDVVRRWGRLYPPRDKTRKALEASEE